MVRSMAGRGLPLAASHSYHSYLTVFLVLEVRLGRGVGVNDVESASVERELPSNLNVSQSVESILVLGNLHDGIMMVQYGVVNMVPRLVVGRVRRSIERPVTWWRFMKLPCGTPEFSVFCSLI